MPSPPSHFDRTHGTEQIIGSAVFLRGPSGFFVCEPSVFINDQDLLMFRN